MCLRRNGAQALSSLTGIETNVTQRPDAINTALFLCDLQEKFRPVIHEMGAAIDTSRLMLAASIELGLPVAVTEQYPRGLGHTVSELSELLTPEHTVVEKVTFSMVCSGENEDPASSSMMQDFIIENDIRKVLLCGVETHVCVLQTTLDLLAMDIDVTIIVDGVSSQRPTDRSVALDRLAKAGAVLSTAEATLFQLLEDAKHPKFKAVSKLVQQPRILTDAGDLLGL
jgi:nicotinamidase-related amidase